MNEGEKDAVREGEGRVDTTDGEKLRRAFECLFQRQKNENERVYTFIKGMSEGDTLY